MMIYPFLCVLTLLALVAPQTIPAKAQTPQSDQPQPTGAQPAGAAKQNSTEMKAANSPGGSQELDESMILFDLQVVRRDTGELITGLATSDLQLVEDGFTRPVKQLSYGRLPLSVVLLVDVSKSFQPALEKLKTGMANALEKLGHKDEVAIIAFGERALVMEGFTRDRKTIAGKFASLDASALRNIIGDKQKLENGLIKAGAELDKAHPLRRRVIVLLTTENSFSWLPKPSRFNQTRSREVIHAGSTINGLILVKGPGLFSKALMTAATIGAGYPPYIHQTPPVVNAWAGRTGGEVFSTPRDGLSTGLIALFERMRQRLTVGFTPLDKTMDGSFRRLNVLVSPNLERRVGDVELRFPEGYLAKPRILR
jgi:VWFA-related protein